MSDTFDHMSDAFDSYERGDHDTGGRMGGSYKVKDVNYYHSYVEYQFILQESEMAFQFRINGNIYWVAKSLIRTHDLSRRVILVHTKTFLSIVNKSKKVYSSTGPIISNK